MAVTPIMLSCRALLFVIAWPVTVAAQATASADTLGEARRLRDGGRTSEASALLRAWLAHHADDVDAALLLAQTAYWMGQRDTARQHYEALLERRPDHSRIRLDYGRFLLETGDGRRARAVVEPLVDSDTARGPALELLGTIAYWHGDFTLARRRFRDALLADSGLQDARRQLREIVAFAAPWIETRGDASLDDQPLDRLAGHARGGWFLTPLWSVSGAAQPMLYRLEGNTTAEAILLEAGTSAYLPALRMESELSGGFLSQSFSESAEWTGAARIGLRLPARLRVSAAASRAPYHHTTASLQTPVMTTQTGITLNWNSPRGWLGEAAWQDTRFPDRNVTRTAYAWLLVPLVYRRQAELQVGYAFSSQDARESRFVLADTAQQGPPGSPNFDLQGRYVPYYTPSGIEAHSLVAASRIRPAPRFAVDAGVSVALRAWENAPQLRVVAFQPPGPPIVVREFISRTFTPWNARIGFDAALTPELSLGGRVEHSRTSFYQASTFSLRLTRRFVGFAMRRDRVN